MEESRDNQEASHAGSDVPLKAKNQEQPAGSASWPPAPGPQAEASRSLAKSFQIGLSLGGLGLAVALLWVLVWGLGRPDPRNSPQKLLTNGIHAVIDLPALSEPKTNLTAADLEFGELQVERMVEDRPKMARYVTKNDPVWRFCARAFAGEASGERIFWQSGLPTGGEYQSEHQYPYKGQTSCIRIRKEYASGDLAGTPLPCEELWSCAVFEIENLRNHSAFEVLFENGLKGKLSREEWIREHTKLEYGALRRTAAQYQKLWRPMAETRGIRSSSQYWGIDIPDTYESWIALYTDPKSYPWNVYGRWYDWEILPYAHRIQPQLGR